MPFATGPNGITNLADKRRERAGFDKLAVLETPDADLIAERERMDEVWAKAAGERPPLTDEAKQLIARHVDEARSSLLAASQLCMDRDDLISIHARVASVALEVETLLSDLAGGGEAA